MQVQSSAFGWDHIIPSVVQLGFIFIESGASGRFLSPEDVGHAERATDTQDLGLKMLVVAFKVHEIARDEVSIFLLLLPFLAILNFVLPHQHSMEHPAKILWDCIHSLSVLLHVL